MDHPNIARVLDAGATASGRPFFVMELVKGTPITASATFAAHYTAAARAFVPVCQAIQHAHQKGIIHRDIKPSNVLVALYDDHPVPKVIDFGVAKATGSHRADAVDWLRPVVGTPEYMSPEQAALNNLDIDTRSDSTPWAYCSTSCYGHDAGGPQSLGRRRCWRYCGSSARSSRRARVPD